jgi:hypothetical protein
MAGQIAAQGHPPIERGPGSDPLHRCPANARGFVELTLAEADFDCRANALVGKHVVGILAGSDPGQIGRPWPGGVWRFGGGSGRGCLRGLGCGKSEIALGMD